MSDLDDIARLIREGDDFLVSSHISPDGDAVGSQLALLHLLRQFGKRVQVVNSDPVPGLLRFLPGWEQIRPPGELRLPSRHTFILDCGAPGRTGGVVDEADPAFGILVNIDHHATNSPWGRYNLHDAAASSTAELIWRLVMRMTGRPSVEIARCLYTGLLSDTGSFRYSSTTPEAFAMARSLLEAGADPAAIATHLYDHVPYATLRLLGKVLARVAHTPDGLVSWIAISADDLATTGTAWEDTEEFVNYPRAIPGILVACCFKEHEPRRIKVSFRSRGALDVGAIAKDYGGGGHLNASGCTLDGTLNEIVERVVNEVHTLALAAGSSLNKN